jgi:hypothetical protein
LPDLIRQSIFLRTNTPSNQHSAKTFAGESSGAFHHILPSSPGSTRR